jgi:hypothetical protein
VKLTLRLIGLVGTGIFGLLLVLTYASPIRVERGARVFIQAEIESQIAKGSTRLYDGPAATRAGRFAASLAEEYRQESAALQKELASNLHARIASIVSRLQKGDCECRQRIVAALDAGARARIAMLDRAGTQLNAVIEAQYGMIVADLLRDLRIFASVNLFAYGSLLVLAFALPGRSRQLFVPAVLLAVASLVASAFYVLNQNWFFTIIFRDYLGWGYGAWLLLVYALLCDIVMFRARLTRWIVQAVGGATGPC